MRNESVSLRLAFGLALFGVVPALPWPARAPSRPGRVPNEIVARERGLLHHPQQDEPRVETYYIQTLRPDADPGSVPARDRYFLGGLRLAEETHRRGQGSASFEAESVGAAHRAPLGSRST